MPSNAGKNAVFRCLVSQVQVWQNKKTETTHFTVLFPFLGVANR